MLAGGITSEIFSLIFIERIINSYDQDPEIIMKDKLLRVLSIFSLLYIISLLMLFFSGVERFTIYSIIIGAATLSELAFRKSQKGRTFRVAIGSAISLLLLMDSFRHIALGIFF